MFAFSFSFDKPIKIKKEDLFNFKGAKSSYKVVKSISAQASQLNRCCGCLVARIHYPQTARTSRAPSENPFFQMSLFIYLFRCNSLEISPVNPPIAKHTIRLKGKHAGRRKEERNVSELQRGETFSAVLKEQETELDFRQCQIPEGGERNSHSESCQGMSPEPGLPKTLFDLLTCSWVLCLYLSSFWHPHVTPSESQAWLSF